MSSLLFAVSELSHSFPHSLSGSLPILAKAEGGCISGKESSFSSGRHFHHIYYACVSVKRRGYNGRDFITIGSQSRTLEEVAKWLQFWAGKNTIGQTTIVFGVLGDFQ